MYFTLSQLQYLILAVFGGLLLVFVLIVGYWSYKLNLARRRELTPADTEKTDDLGEEEFADGLKESRKPVPLFVTLLIVAILLWGVAYVVAVALGGLYVQ